MKKPKKDTVLQPRLRVYHAGEVALGPGKVELLGHVAETGNLSEAARRMKMSYMKAWLLVQIMNRSFRKPLVQLERGGAQGGGSGITETGREVLALYRRMHEESLKAAEEPWKRLSGLLKKTPARRSP
jgi:molybdate transport system regulatory protein